MQHSKAIKQKCLRSQKIILKLKSSLRYNLYCTRVGTAGEIQYSIIKIVNLALRRCILTSFSYPFFAQALEHGLGGVILKVEDAEDVLQLKVFSFRIGLLECKAQIIT